MDIKDFVKQKNDAIQAAAAEHEKTRLRLEAELVASEQARDRLVEKLSAERDEAVLKEKLKAFPKALVDDHKTCSICGDLMRPFQIMQDGKLVKIWACRAGNLQENHDLIRVP